MTELAGRRILVVEDDYLIARGLVRHLTRLGVEVEGPAAEASAALPIATEAGLDFALLDITLRGGTSLPVADVLRQRGVGFAFLTGYTTPPIPAAYSEVPRLTKPFTPDELSAFLVALILGTDA